MGAFLGSIGVPPVCVTAGQCGCVCVCFPRAPSSFTTAAFHRINIALHNPASVSARLDPLPQPRSTRSLYASNPILPSNRVNFYPFSSAHSRVIGAPMTRRWRFDRWYPDGWKRKRILESRNQDRPVLRTTWLTTLDNVKGILLSNPRYIFLRNVRFRVIYYFSFNIHRVCMQNVYLKLTWNGEDPNSEYFGFIRDLFGGILWRFLISRIVN